MIEYADYNETSLQGAEKSQENSIVESKASSLGFTSEAQERMWMDLVQKESVRGYSNRHF